VQRPRQECEKGASILMALAISSLACAVDASWALSGLHADGGWRSQSPPWHASLRRGARGGGGTPSIAGAICAICSFRRRRRASDRTCRWRAPGRVPVPRGVAIRASPSSANRRQSGRRQRVLPDGEGTPCACSDAVIASTSERMPVTLEAAEKAPTRSGRCACARSPASSACRSSPPRRRLADAHDVREEQNHSNAATQNHSNANRLPGWDLARPAPRPVCAERMLTLSTSEYL
jgi:hypothetical protein